MQIRRRLALLAGTALVVQGLTGIMSPAAVAGADDDLAAFFYWKLPLGESGSRSADPTYGFSVAQTQDGWLMAPSVYGVDRVQLPALVDLRFGGDEDPLPSLSFSGIDVGAAIENGLFQNAPGPGPGLGEWLLIGAGAALGGITACAAAGCFEGDDDPAVDGGEGGEGAPVTAN